MNVTISEGFSELDKIVDRMSNPEQPIEEAIKDYERGIKLVRELDKALKDVEKKIQILNSDTGELETSEDDNNEDAIPFV